MNLKLTTSSLFLFGALASNIAFAELIHDFGHTGYFRIGAGLSEDEGPQEFFQAPGAGAKYRLGNENDWIELDLYDTVRAAPDGPYVHVELMAAFGGDQLDKIEFDDMVQVFLEAGDFSSVLGNPKVWIGQRYYDRRDIHINDFFYLNTLQDFVGGGIRDMDLGFGKLAVAFGRQNADDDSATPFDESGIIQSRLDVRLSDIALSDNGSLTFWVGYDSSNGDSGNSVEALGGYGVGVIYTRKEFFGGFDHFVVQYGRGLGRHAGKGGLDDAVASVTSAAARRAFDDAETFRIANVNLIEFSPNWSLMTSLVYEDTQAADFDDSDQTWSSLGIRPIWYLNDNFRIPVEIGWDRVKDNANDTDGALLKTTVAAEYALERGFWARPVLRLFATYANWSDEFRGRIGGDTYAEETTGWSVGVQAETWW